MLSKIFSETLICLKVTNTTTKLSQKVLIIVTLHRKHFESFVWEVQLLCDNGCSKFHQVNWSLHDIYSLIPL